MLLLRQPSRQPLRTRTAGIIGKVLGGKLQLTHVENAESTAVI